MDDKFKTFNEAINITAVNPTANTFVNTCFGAITATHHRHLIESSYAIHMALGEFYTSLQGLLDTATEAYLADPQKTLEFAHVDFSNGGAIDGVKNATIAFRNVVNDDAVINILDDICSLCATTQYKMKRLS